MVCVVGQTLANIGQTDGQTSLLFLSCISGRFDEVMAYVGELGHGRLFSCFPNADGSMNGHDERPFVSFPQVFMSKQCA